ncbi:hypothetical protein C0Q70_12066 [Pomacea canaliculata]|uniref:39S ribosomal protein L41, mitochondrial n=1 Tax=Pomacea canaliculata TaxID=400727 RepID=A0A2T7P0G3_POMCA|nr:39S ribosomal protein L41, mitochondrial-like [Pomacea canaliculata]PVD26918.1 hypothetical protein C0Q70_12066 [Pomacea canaliculata]
MWNSNWQRLTTCARLFSTNVRLEGKRSREPFDKRFPVTGKHGAAFRKGGSPTMEKMLAVHNVPPNGFFDKKKGYFTTVPEMIPEFIVPDLTDFKLKPYVSYKVPEVHQSKMTARDLFQATYGAELEHSVREGKMVVKDGQFIPVEEASKNR